jgi:hypothetical protein
MMKLRYRLALGAFLTCLILYWMSGLPLQRGWPLWGTGVLTVMATIVGFACGYGLEDKNE